MADEPDVAAHRIGIRSRWCGPRRLSSPACAAPRRRPPGPRPPAAGSKGTRARPGPRPRRRESTRPYRPRRRLLRALPRSACRRRASSRARRRG
jgi:hypothetical protein